MEWSGAWSGIRGPLREVLGKVEKAEALGPWTCLEGPLGNALGASAPEIASREGSYKRPACSILVFGVVVIRLSCSLSVTVLLP